MPLSLQRFHFFAVGKSSQNVISYRGRSKQPLVRFWRQLQCPIFWDGMYLSTSYNLGWCPIFQDVLYYKIGFSLFSMIRCPIFQDIPNPKQDVLFSIWTSYFLGRPVQMIRPNFRNRYIFVAQDLRTLLQSLYCQNYNFHYCD